MSNPPAIPTHRQPGFFVCFLPWDTLGFSHFLLHLFVKIENKKVAAGPQMRPKTNERRHSAAAACQPCRCILLYAHATTRVNYGLCWVSVFVFHHNNVHKKSGNEWFISLMIHSLHLASFPRPPVQNLETVHLLSANTKNRGPDLNQLMAKTMKALSK